MMLTKEWSSDMVVGRATTLNLFSSELIPRISTLYHWIDRSIMHTKNIDLLEKVSRKPRSDSPTHRENRRVLVPSIKERPEDIKSRVHFGHWEIDTILGARHKDELVLLTLVERGTKENQHKLIPRFIPKSKRLAEISTQTINRIQ